MTHCACYLQEMERERQEAAAAKEKRESEQAARGVKFTLRKAREPEEKKAPLVEGPVFGHDESSEDGDTAGQTVLRADLQLLESTFPLLIPSFNHVFVIFGMFHLIRLITSKCNILEVKTIVLA